ncbi:MAG TPA: bifunctional precorrin-2 dehydrogenase/sirohydrochlorin ferrochelatase [bacterium]|nr:bifunctional precorrin-2 dehydrogenase/sirohydrochlorin ferrochelatase [bacterium]
MAGLFPVLLNVKDRLCVVVGGGEVALRKVMTLLERGAIVKVVSPELRPEFRELVEQSLIEWESRAYRQGDLEGAFLGVAAADDAEVNAQVRHEGWTRHVLVNVVDDPAGSDYQVPSFFEDGDLLVAVSTSGASPAVARTLRRMVQGYLGGSFGEALKLISDFRERVKGEVADGKDRVRFWEQAVTPELLEKVRKGALGEVRAMLEQALVKFKEEARR